MSEGMFVCGGNAAPGRAIEILAGLADCCEGALDGPADCTCWETIYDVEQHRVLEHLARDPEGTAPWPTMCDDCAYRPDSPEADGDGRYIGKPPEGSDVPFWCHRGMRKPTGWRHRLGVFIGADGDYYRPPLRRIVVDGDPNTEGALVPFQADGTPARRCAGWAAHERANTDA